ncbi:MAG: YdeI/OmpD-associated family protein, partial [Acidimicrobiia bacterium]
LVVPDDLAAALATNPQAQTTFEGFAASAKQLYLWWIKSAKRPETRAQRIADTVWLVERGIKQPGRVAQ